MAPRIFVTSIGDSLRLGPCGAVPWPPEGRRRTWTVFDWFTGQPVEFEGEILCALDIQEADNLIDLINGSIGCAEGRLEDGTESDPRGTLRRPEGLPRGRHHVRRRGGNCRVPSGDHQTRQVRVSDHDPVDRAGRGSFIPFRQAARSTKSRLILLAEPPNLQIGSGRNVLIECFPTGLSVIHDLLICLGHAGNFTAPQPPLTSPLNVPPTAGKEAREQAID